MVLEISVLMAQFPSKHIAKLSYEYRTLGLGFANIGGLLMTSGYSVRLRRGPRDLRRDLRNHDRNVAYATSAEMAGELGPFPGYEEQCQPHAPRDAQPPECRLWTSRWL